MRLLEIYPPSSFVVAAVAGTLLLVGGLKLALPVLVGAGLMALGHRLDLYGVRRAR